MAQRRQYGDIARISAQSSTLRLLTTSRQLSRADQGRHRADGFDPATGSTGSGVSLEAGRTVSFQPGGMHLMIEDITRPLVDGDVFDITLTFVTAGQRTVAVSVTDDI